ncbi:hypothetical protein QYE76_054460 [Lolium multiflorum]|uniref:Uncharacterized protein n=1 Tax=Lolium multiflorum TaxID=4521 RepID=A0AAD8SXR0_LOLMU|nr:hypothetical protein QYE76_054460 [Lolium multiflorum]
MASTVAASPWRRRGRRRAGYLVPQNMRLPSSGGWRMVVNDVGVPPPPHGMERWRDAIRTREAHLTAEERADPT